MKRTVEEKQSFPYKVKVKWINGKRFVASDDAGHSIVMDAPKKHGGEDSGFTPMQLLLVALGGCTGVDVTEILRKQRQKLEDLEIIVSGERVLEHPRVYGRVHVEYRLTGKDLNKKFVKQAIELSQDKYCSVGAIIRSKAEVSHDQVLHQL